MSSESYSLIESGDGEANEPRTSSSPNATDDTTTSSTYHSNRLSGEVDPSASTTESSVSGPVKSKSNQRKLKKKYKRDEHQTPLLNQPTLTSESDAQIEAYQPPRTTSPEDSTYSPTAPFLTTSPTRASPNHPHTTMNSTTTSPSTNHFGSPSSNEMNTNAHTQPAGVTPHTLSQDPEETGGLTSVPLHAPEDEEYATNTTTTEPHRYSNTTSTASTASTGSGDYRNTRQTPEVSQRRFKEDEDEPTDIPETKYRHWGSSFLPGPPCIRNILGNELCERFTYYGLRAILVLYFHEQLDWSKDDSISLFSYSAALAYFMPLLGGYLSDSYFGKYKTILRFSMIYVTGSVLLACSAIQGIAWLAIIGLIFIGVGTGGIKPCVSSFGADQFTSSTITSHEQLKKREHDISSYFHFFYFAINFGSVGSFVITPLLRRYCGYAIAFGVPAILLTIAVFIFWKARREYYHGPIGGSVIAQVWQVFRVAWKRRRTSPRPAVPIATLSMTQEEQVAASSTVPHNWLDAALLDPHITSVQVENAKALWRVLPIFAVFPVFWMLFDQQSSSWTLQADEMKLHGLQPEQIGVTNPILVMILLPIFDRLIYPAVDRCGIHFTALRRMGVGMIISVFAFLLSAGVEYQINQNEEKSVSVFWQIPQIFLISVAEILISVTGLEFAYTQATAALKSSIAAIFLITTAIGDLLTGVLYTALSKVMSSTSMYVLFAGLMVLNFFAFLYVASQYHPVVVLDQKVRGEEEEEETEEEKMRRLTGQIQIRVDEKDGIELQETKSAAIHHPKPITHPTHLKQASSTSILANEREREDEEAVSEIDHR